MATLEELSQAVIQLGRENQKLRRSLSRMMRRVRSNDLSNPITALSRDLVDLGEVPTVRLSQTSAQTITANAWRTVTLQLADFDFTGNGADLANNRIIIRRGGIYLLIGRVSTASNANEIDRHVGYLLNGSIHRTWGPLMAANETCRVGFSDTIELSIGDTLILAAFVRTTNLLTTVDVETRSFISATLIASGS